MCTSRTRGFSLIEVIMFILVVSVGLVTVINVFRIAGSSSADPVMRRQSFAIAQSLMEEVTNASFNDPCHQGDPSVTGCFSGSPTPANRAQFDDIVDYNGFHMDATSNSPWNCSGGQTGICNLNGSAVTGLGGYAASVSVTSAIYGSVRSIVSTLYQPGPILSGSACVNNQAANTSNSAVCQITVTVTDPNGNQVVLQGYRGNY